jgi:hypothetical protein
MDCSLELMKLTLKIVKRKETVHNVSERENERKSKSVGV